MSTVVASNHVDWSRNKHPSLATQKGCHEHARKPYLNIVTQASRPPPTSSCASATVAKPFLALNDGCLSSNLATNRIKHKLSKLVHNTLILQHASMRYISTYRIFSQFTTRTCCKMQASHP
eukprot:TRINITY_DN12072_c0_g3_i4.p1 TRINITY_DN12072_c0_g3~~TRINITY_DN12072_c0_g3_i4.p1  ORF type:complete len:121 (-),score=3.58 TRINITY_DN12072_c0_g3_i4:154-516(-)